MRIEPVWRPLEGRCIEFYYQLVTLQARSWPRVGITNCRVSPVINPVFDTKEIDESHLPSYIFCLLRANPLSKKTSDSFMTSKVSVGEGDT
jgi:hypothetical protein